MMKLHEIISSEFKKYGTIVKYTQDARLEEFLYTEKVTSESNKTSELYKFDAPVMLEPIEGVGVIFIEVENGFRMFLFDKIVTINQDIWFTVVPYQCRFAWQIKYNSVNKTKKLDETLTATGIIQKIKIDAIYTVLYQEKANGFNFKGESHPYWEMTYMDTGNMICTVDGEEILLKQGNLMFFTPNQFHKQRAADHGQLKFFTITFDLNFMDIDLFKYKIMKADIAIHRYIKQILSETSMDLPYSDEVIIATLTNLMVIAIRLAKEAIVVSEVRSVLSINTTNDLITNCINYIDENLAGDLTIDELAKKTCISTSYLSKLFKLELGVGPRQYIKERKLQKAKDLIRNGTYSITLISDMMGYCSGAYFSTEFKKMFGVTPREFSKSVSL